MRLGIFGGTFDPPHLGHQIIAAEAAGQAHLDKVLWLLTPQSPLKIGQQITPVEYRMEMVRAAIAAFPFFEFSDIDILRPPPQYTVDTVRHVRQGYPNDRLFLLIGEDSLIDLPDWHTPGAMLDLLDGMIVTQRMGKDAELKQLMVKIPELAGKLQFLDTPIIEISSREVRRRIHTREMVDHFLVPSVTAIIKKYNLYRFD